MDSPVFQGDDRSVVAAWRKAGHPDEWIAEQLGYSVELVQRVKPQNLFVPTPDEIAAGKAAIHAKWSAREAKRRRVDIASGAQRVEFPQFCERTGKPLA